MKTRDTDINVGVYCCEHRAGKGFQGEAQRIAGMIKERMRVKSTKLYVDVEDGTTGLRPERTRLVEACRRGR